MRCPPAQTVAVAARRESPQRRCAFARRGLSAPEMLACPGFDSLGVSYRPIHGQGPASGGFTCCHLQLSETPRGYAAVCGHPEGPFNDWLPSARRPSPGGTRSAGRR
jgi:hypothetical protein